MVTWQGCTSMAKPSSGGNGGVIAVALREGEREQGRGSEWVGEGKRDVACTLACSGLACGPIIGVRPARGGRMPRAVGCDGQVQTDHEARRW
jgi:hypothetical protein